MEFPRRSGAGQRLASRCLPGECHGLVGEKGQASRTLSKCIIGENRMTSGRAVRRGEEGAAQRLGTSRIPSGAGMQIVHQGVRADERDDRAGEHLHRPLQERAGFIAWSTLRAQAAEIMDFLQCDVNLDVPVRALRTAEKQIVQLAKAVMSRSRILFLDELTAGSRRQGHF